MGRPDPQLKDAILAHLRKNHSGMSRHWFDDIEPLEVSGGTLRLLVREQVQLKYLKRCCIEQFQEAAQAVTGRLLAVRFVGESEVADDSGMTGTTGMTGTSGPMVGTGTGAPRRAAGGRSSSSGSARSASSVSAEAGSSRSSGSSGSSISDGSPGDALDEVGARVDAADTLADLDDDMFLSPDYSFDNFIVGPDNRLAHAAAIAVARKPGKAYNPFFIHSGVGLGKTHLLQAICQATLQDHRGLRVYYTSCSGFMNQFFEAVQVGHMTSFRHRFRNVDLLVIDDIHDLSRRERAQEEFFHTFNALYQAGRQIVLSSDAPPNEIADLKERLTSRFNCGLVAQIDRPCFETRVEIVKSKAAIRGMTIPEDVASYIAAKVDTNIRELEGAITQIQNLAVVSEATIDLELAKQAIGEQAVRNGSRHPSIQQIIDAISRFYDVKLTDLLSKRRHKSVALPRQIGMWLARKHTRYSLEEIGGYFGGRDHTTVMHAIKAVNKRRDGDALLDHDVSRLEHEILVQFPSHGSGDGIESQS